MKKAGDIKINKCYDKYKTTMTAKEMIDDLLKRGKIELNEHVAIQLMMAGERLEARENICVQTGIECGFPCYDGCPIYNENKWIDTMIRKPMRTGDYLCINPNGFRGVEWVIARFDKYNDSWYMGSDTVHVSHWQLLPPMPETE